MGKIRVKTLGDEDKEKKQKKEAQQRAQAKKAQAQGEAKLEEPTTQTPVSTDVPAEKPAKKAKKVLKKKKTRSDSYLSVVQKVEKDKLYALKAAVTLLEELKHSKFDETVELHINTIEKGVSGNVTLPHGTGKQVRVEIVNQSEDPKHVEDVIKNIEAGKIEFDVLIATPDSMPKLAKIARFLGPKGLMPNPKNGTVTAKPDAVAKKFQGGQVNFKTEAKFPIIHLTVGKLSFGNKKLTENIQATIAAIQTKNIKNTTLKSTMSPAIKLDTSNL